MSLLAFEASSFAKNTTLQVGTPVRLRLVGSVNSQTAKKGQIINFEVVEDVRVGNSIIIDRGALAVGTITKVQSKRRLNRNGNLSFRLDYVNAVDRNKVPLRIGENAGTREIAIKQRIEESPNASLKQSGRLGGIVKSLTGVAVPALGSVGPASAFAIGRLLMKKGSDVRILNGQLLDAFVDGSVAVNGRRVSANRLANNRINVRSASSNHSGEAIFHRRRR
jgi:hypothetical protein